MPKPKKTATRCPKYLPADNPARIERDSAIIAMAAKGQPYSQIAASNGIDKSRVCQILSDEDAKAKLQAIIHTHIQATKQIQANLISIASTTPGENEHIKTGDILAATKEHNQIIGIAGAHTQQNVFINNLYQQDNRQVITPDVLRLLEGRTSQVIDIEVPEP